MCEPPSNLSSHLIQSPQHARSTSYATTPTLALAVSCSRARGDRCFLFFALVTFGVGGLIFALAAKPIAFDWAGEAHAVRMHGLVAIVAKENAPLIVATVAQDARAFVARHTERLTRLRMHACGGRGAGTRRPWLRPAPPPVTRFRGAIIWAQYHFCVTTSTSTATLTTLTST